MSVPQNQTELPRSGSAWITLAVSTIALMLLCRWALQNQDMLFQQVLGTSQIAITDRLGSESKLAVNTAQQNDAGADIEIAGSAEKAPKQATAQNSENGGPATQEAEDSALAKGVSDERQADAKLTNATLTDNEAQQPVARLSTSDEATDESATAKEETLNIPTDGTTLDEVEKDTEVASPSAVQKVAANDPMSEQTAAKNSVTERLAALEENAKTLAEKADEKADKEEAAEAKAAEAKAAEAKAAEAKAAEAKAAEAKAAEAKAAEAKAAEVKAAEVKAAEAKAAVEKTRTAKLAAEAQQAEQFAALPNRTIPTVSIVDAPKQDAVVTESAFEKTRREDLAKLPELATQVRFVPNDIEPDAEAKQSMDRMFELLFLYSETTVTVQVASNEYEIDDNNQLISRERALVIINYLIERGLDVGRFRIRALGKQGLPFDNHQVMVVATVIDK